VSGPPQSGSDPIPGVGSAAPDPADTGLAPVPRSEASPDALAPVGGPALPHAQSAEIRKGLLYALGAFGTWAIVIPVFFRVLSKQGVDPFEMVGQRVAFGVPFLLLMIAYSRQWGTLRRAFTDLKILKFLIPSTLLIGINWYFFIVAVDEGHLSHAGLGYYINPVVSVALGYLFLKERLRSLQFVALGLGVAAVGVLTVAEGFLPIISIILPVSFGLYGLLRKQAGVGPVVGLTVETMLLLPLSLGLLIWLTAEGRTMFLVGPGWVSGIMLLGGLATVAPLAWFAAAAKRLPLSTLGLMQYLSPTGQTLLAAVFFGESFPPLKWGAFGLIWIAIAVFTTDAVRQNGKARRERHAAAHPAART
jgi:chloramphenicol-sensitive protein RarD